MQSPCVRYNVHACLEWDKLVLNEFNTFAFYKVVQRRSGGVVNV